MRLSSGGSDEPGIGESGKRKDKVLSNVRRVFFLIYFQNDTFHRVNVRKTAALFLESIQQFAMNS